MVLLYDATATHNTQWAQMAPSGVEAVVVSDLSTFDEVIGRAHLVVARLQREGNRDRGLISRLQTLRTTHPLKSIIIVCGTGPANPAAFADVTLSIEEADQGLWSTIRHVEDRALLPCLADIVRKADNVPPPLRLAIMHILMRPVPLSSIKELAAETGCDRRTLPRLWDLTFSNGGCRLVDFLDWIVLLYIMGRKTSKRPWVMIAKDVSLVEDTLARSSRKLLNLTLSELARLGQPIVITKFRAVFEELFGSWPDRVPLDVPLERPAHHVLVVDDHEAIIQFLERSLRRAGFQISTARSGSEALARMSIERPLPTIVLTDIKMSGMDGIELARHVTQRWPSVRVILMSAFISPDLARRGLQHEQIGQTVQFLAKPFTAGRIMALLRAACEEML